MAMRRTASERCGADYFHAQGAPHKSMAPSTLAIIASTSIMLLGCGGSKSTIIKHSANNGDDPLKVNGTIEGTSFSVERIHYMHASASGSSLDPCRGVWPQTHSTVNFRRSLDGTPSWGLKLTAAGKRLLGPVVLVSMPFAFVNGRAINPPYAPHLESDSYDYHGSFNVYQLFDGGSGTLKTGDKVTLYWYLDSHTGMAQRYITCEVPPPGSS